jgi:hypothetical protein
MGEPARNCPKMKTKHMRLHKDSGFPSLLDKSGKPIPADELPSFEANIDSWSAAAGLDALCETTAAMIKISEDQASIVSYFGNPDIGQLQTIEEKREFFKTLANTRMGPSLDLTTNEADCAACTNENIQDMELKFNVLSAQFSRNLMQATTIQGTIHTAFPQFFSSSIALALKPETPRMLQGFVQFQQLRKNLGKDLPGSCLHQQNDYVKRF